MIPPASLYCQLRKFLRCYVEVENIPTMKQLYGIRSQAASDVLLNALDGHHVAVDYGSYRILAEGRRSVACTHFPFGMTAFRYLVSLSGHVLIQ